MTLLQRLFGFRGRLSRLDWWLFAIALNIVGAVLHSVLTPILVQPGATVWGSETAPGQLVSLGITVALLWPTLALAVKRRHDCGNHGILTSALFVALTALNSAPLYYFALAVWAFSHWAWIGIGLLILAFIWLWGWLVIALGVLPGTPGPNRYGEPTPPLLSLPARVT